MLADELFTKILKSLETCVLINNNLRGKFISSLELPITFDERFRVTSLPLFIPDLNLLSHEFDNFMLKVLYCLKLY